MEGRGVTPNAISYNAAVEALEFASRFEEAAELLMEARGHGFYIKAFTSTSKIDLHDCSEAVARTIMRIVLSEVQSGFRKPGKLTIITGWGKHSEDKPVLPGEVRSFLRDYYDLELTEVPGNRGRFVIPLGSIQKWLEI